jgi:hypothetical protein
MTDRTNAERQRRYIARLKAAAAKAGVTNAPASPVDAEATIQLAQPCAPRRQRVHMEKGESLTAEEKAAATAALRGVCYRSLEEHNRDLQKELAQAKARIVELEKAGAVAAAEIAKLKAALKEAQAARKPSAQSPASRNRSDGGGVQDENARLKARIDELEVNAKRSRFSGKGYIMPKKQFTNLRLCMHPDTLAFLETAVKDHPALQPKVESLTKQFAKAAMTLTEFKDVLVNEAAEEARKRSDAFRAAARWKRDEELRKKARAKQEARSAAAKQRAAAKRATAQAQGGDK